ADDGTHGRQVWRSDGTTAGTFLLQDINPGGFSYPFALTSFNGQLFWSENGLWKSDGTVAGTVLVKDISVSPYGPTAPLTVAFGKLFFGATDGAHGVELWDSDGTTQGTVLFKVLNPNSNSTFPDGITYSSFVNGTLYFGAGVAQLGVEPWKSDG